MAAIDRRMLPIFISLLYGCVVCSQDLPEIPSYTNDPYKEYLEQRLQNAEEDQLVFDILNQLVHQGHAQTRNDGYLPLYLQTIGSDVVEEPATPDFLRTVLDDLELSSEDKRSDRDTQEMNRRKATRNAHYRTLLFGKRYSKQSLHGIKKSRRSKSKLRTLPYGK